MFVSTFAHERNLNMKRFIFIVCFFVFATASYAQQIPVDVVYLKDGSIVQGIIIEQIPDDTLKIRIQGGSVFVFKMEDVLKINRTLKSVQTHGYQIGRKEPVVGCLLSFLVPGAGQLYNEDFGGAGLYFGCFIISSTVFFSSLEEDVFGWYIPDNNRTTAALGLVGMLTASICSMTDAAITAQDINKQLENRITLLESDGVVLTLNPLPVCSDYGAMLSFRF